MNTNSRSSFDDRYFACGLNRDTGQPAWANHLHAIGETARRLQYPEGGCAFYTLPPLVDKAETDDLVCLKMGLAHDGERALSSQDLIRLGWVTPEGIRASALQGSPLIVCLNKRSPQAFIYRGLFAIAAAHFWSGVRSLLLTDNLRLMAAYLPHPQLNEAILPQHFLFRASFDSNTPIRGVTRLCEGEMLSWGPTGLKVTVERDLRPFIHPDTQQPYRQCDAAEFFEAIRRVMRLYLDGRTRATATMFSGGIDSSLLYVAAAAQPEVDFCFPAFSYTAETPDMQIEMENARTASAALDAQHAFAPMSAQTYCASLAQSIEALGQPVSDDVRPCFFFLAGYIAEHAPDIVQLLHGHISEAFFGAASAERMVQGDRYQRWPILLLWLAGKLVEPFSPSKAYGAMQAVDELLSRKNPDRLSSKMKLAPFTDQELVLRCFTNDELIRAFEIRAEKSLRYLNSNVWTERYNTLHLFDVGIGSANLTRQLGQYYGREYVFPYADEIVAKFAFSIEPGSRYAHEHVGKHIISNALKAAVPKFDVDRPKGWSSMGQAQLFAWMRDGELADMVRSIDRPDFLERKDFERKLAEPDWFTWNLLTLDLLKKQVLEPLAWSG